MNCPKCGAPNRDTSRFCSKCGTPLLPSGPVTANDPANTPYPSVFQQPGMGTPPPPAPNLQPYQSSVPYGGNTPLLGVERSVATSIILSLVTCGIYLIIWMYSIGKDIRNYLGQDDPKPGQDLLLLIVTCGIWALYMLYRYPTLVNEMMRRRGLPANDSLPLISLLLGFVGGSVVSVALIQVELNKLWQSYQR